MSGNKLQSSVRYPLHSILSQQINLLDKNTSTTYITIFLLLQSQNQSKQLPKQSKEFIKFHINAKINQFTS